MRRRIDELTRFWRFEIVLRLSIGQLVSIIFVATLIVLVLAAIITMFLLGPEALGRII